MKNEEIRQRQGREIQERTFEFARRIVRLYQHLEKSGPTIYGTHQERDFGVPRVACYPCVAIALANESPVAHKQKVKSSLQGV